MIVNRENLIPLLKEIAQWRAAAFQRIAPAPGGANAARRHQLTRSRLLCSNNVGLAQIGHHIVNCRKESRKGERAKARKEKR